MWWRDRRQETSYFPAVKFCRRLRTCLWPFSISVIRHKRINKKGQNYFRDSTCSLHLSKIYTMYRRLHLPVNARAQNMFSLDVKRLSLGCTTLKFSRPNVKFYFSILLKGRCFQSMSKEEIIRKVSHFQVIWGIKWKNLHRIILLQKWVEDYASARVQFQKSLSSTTWLEARLPKRWIVRTVPKCSFQDSVLLETMVQASGSSSLKELRDDLAIHGDCGELSTSTISRNIRKKLPSGRNYPEKDWGNVCRSVLLPKIQCKLNCTLTIEKIKILHLLSFSMSQVFNCLMPVTETLVTHLSVKIA